MSTAAFGFHRVLWEEDNTDNLHPLLLFFTSFRSAPLFINFLSLFLFIDRCWCCRDVTPEKMVFRFIRTGSILNGFERSLCTPLFFLMSSLICLFHVNFWATLCYWYWFVAHEATMQVANLLIASESVVETIQHLTGCNFNIAHKRHILEMKNKLNDIDFLIYVYIRSLLILEFLSFLPKRFFSAGTMIW